MVSVVVEHVKEHLRLLEAAAPDQDRQHVHAHKNADGDGHQQLCIRDRLSAAKFSLLFHALSSPLSGAGPARCAKACSQTVGGLLYDR